MTDIQAGKQKAAQAAVDQIESGMMVGLGSGSTTRLAIEILAGKVRDGLSITCVASSQGSFKLATSMGLDVQEFRQQGIDLYLDGADEVDSGYNLIKGGGGALLREKILAFNSSHTIIMVDQGKQVTLLGKFPVPLEVNTFGAFRVKEVIEERYGIRSSLRMYLNSLYITDNGNLILDCLFEEIANPGELNQDLHLIPGVLETGIFCGYVDQLIIGFENKVEKKVLNPLIWLKDS